MDENPFASPQAVELGTDTRFASSAIKVHGKYLVVGSRAVLPPRCVFSNEPPPSAKAASFRLTWSPSFQLSIQPATCYIQCHFGREYRRRKLWTVLVWILMAAMIGAVWVCVDLSSTVLSLTALSMSVVFISIGIVAIFEPGLVAKHARRGEFWVLGCGKEFLDSCADEYGYYEGSVIPRLRPKP